MSERLVVDPITRIEGHLRIETQLEDGVIREAYASGTQFRGLELILKNRDPRDAWVFAQRICGVCTLVHGIASVRAVEDAFGTEVPANAQWVRNMMIAAQFIHDHVMHFYHLHALDWVDVVSAAGADPELAQRWARSTRSATPPSLEALQHTSARLKTMIDSGRLGIFEGGYWGHPGYKLSPEANLVAVTHYLEALEWQREVVKLHTVFGGKNPHPNLVVGGIPSPIDFNSDSAINRERLELVRSVIIQMRDFVDRVYLPDVIAIASFYPEWASRGEAVGNFLCYGDLERANGSGKVFPGGVIVDRNLGDLRELDPRAKDEIREYVAHAWYAYDQGRDQGLHPFEGQTTPRFEGPRPPYKQLDPSGGYSWLKSPRWRDQVMEVGPLARVLMMYARGDDTTVSLVDSTLQRLGLEQSALFSTLGRTAARAIETKVLADELEAWLDKLIDNVSSGDTDTWNDAHWEPSSWPSQAKGVGLMEAPRGALAHYVVIEDQKIANYQAVVPSTWNAGPRDASGQPGPYEAALVGHPVQDPARPLEILRTVHSFDPCIACAVHLWDARGEKLGDARIV